MTNKLPRRSRSADHVEPLEERTLFSGYAVSVVTPLPALSTTFVNTQPSALVRDSGGNLFGVVPQGGAATYGTVFEVNPSTKLLTVLYTFDGTSGVNPLAIAIDSSDNLFGIVQYSAATGSGSTEAPSGSAKLFEISAADRSTATFPYTFSDNAVGNGPSALLVDPSNNVDVLAAGGGANNGGSIVQFAPSTGYAAATVLGSLTTSRFIYSSTLARGSDGTLYGTTIDGGGDGQGNGPGTLFSLSAGASTVTTVATFDPATTGSSPQGTPYVDASGNVFGTTESGTSSANFYGSVWEYSPGTGSLSTVGPIGDAVTNGGTEPLGGVVSDGNGSLIGVSYTGVGTSTAGAAYTVDPAAHTFTSGPSLTASTTGNGAIGSLVADGFGDYFGVTSGGGANSTGAVFEVSPSTGGGGSGGGGGTTGSGTLTPTIARDTLPASVVSDSTLKGSVTVTVTNSGTAASTGVDTVALYASTTGSIDSSATRIVSPVSRKLPLKVGKTTKINFNIRKLSLPAGTYALLAQVTDASGNVSVSNAGGTITVAAPFVNLSAVVGAVKPTLAKIGKTVSFAVTITNTGNIDSTGPLTLAVGLSSDGTNLAVPITTITRSPKIKANGKAAKVTARFKLPTDLDFVNYFPFVSITQGSTTLTATGPEFSPIFGAR